MKKKKGKGSKFIDEKSKQILIFIIIFFISYSILITSVAPKRYNLKEGDIAISDIKAPRDTVDEEATKEIEKEVIANADKQYSLKLEIKSDANKNITQFFNKLISLKTDNIKEDEKILELRKIEAFVLSESQYKLMTSIDPERAIEMQWVLVSAIEKVFENNIIEEKNVNDENMKGATTVSQAKDISKDILMNSDIDSDLKQILIDMANSQIKPNYFYDKEKTNTIITETLKTLPKEMIKKNQIIVKEGEPITKKQIQILTELGLVGKSNQKNYLTVYFALAVLVILVLILQYLYLKKSEDRYLNKTKQMIMIGILNILTLVLARAGMFISPYVLPISASAIIMTMLLNYRISIVINSLNLILVAIIVGYNSQIILVSLISVILVCTSIKRLKGRNEILYSTIFLAIVNSIVSFSMGLMMSNNLKLITSQVLFILLGSLLSGVLAMGILPFLETTFNIITNAKLLELSNPNNPIIKRMLLEAPGTYHHSLMVANLAEVAAESIGADPVIARVGAYYHDTGKLKRPLFFAENQVSGENPHNNIDPKLSTQIILAHTKDGIEIAKQYNIPKIIQDMMVEHHGTTLVKYFYYTVKNASENPESIKEEDFMYSGPIPQSKEAAIVMLADGTEAAVRSIKEPTKEKIKEMVENIIKDKLNSNQLTDSDLTLRDIETIKNSFLNMLNGLYHQRVEYPKDKSEITKNKK